MGILRLAVVGVLATVSTDCFANNLLDFYLQAKEHDQQYQTAVHQRDAAVEARPAAWAALLPQLNATDDIAANRLHVLSSEQSGSGTINNGGSSSGSGGTPSPATTTSLSYFGTRDYSVTLTQPVFDWSAFLSLAQASAQVAQAEATLRSAQQGLITRTANAYFAVLTARDNLGVDLNIHSGYKEQLLQGQAKYKAGLVDITDVRNAQASYDTSSSSIISDRIALSAAVRALGLITGEPVGTIADVRSNIPLQPPQPASEADWAVAAAQNNPDLLTAYYAEKAAKKQIGINESKYLPTLNLQGSVGRDTSHSPFGDDVIDDTVGLTLNWNIFNGGLMQSQVRTAKADEAAAVSSLELQRRTTDENTRNDYQQVVEGIDAIRANRLAVLSSQSSLVATQAGQKVGTRTESDVILATENLAGAEKTYYQSRHSYLTSVLSLKQDAGYLTDADVANINRFLEVASVGALEPSPDQPLSGSADADEALAASDDGKGGSLLLDVSPVPAAPTPPPQPATPAQPVQPNNLPRPLSIAPSELPAPAAPVPAPAPAAAPAPVPPAASSSASGAAGGSSPAAAAAKPAAAPAPVKAPPTPAVAAPAPTPAPVAAAPVPVPVPTPEPAPSDNDGLVTESDCKASAAAWSQGPNRCAGPVGEVANGKSLTLHNITPGMTGSVTLVCRGGQFAEQNDRVCKPK